jgi:CheY-like chemotaxis protein
LVNPIFQYSDRCNIDNVDSLREQNSAQRNKYDNNWYVDNEDNQISFINYTQRYCIGFIDIFESTKETAKIKESRKLRKYYSLFLNTMASIINNFNGKIVKNIGDSLFFYFPNTFDIRDEMAFHDAFECGISMIMSNASLNKKLSGDGLPSINYRISMDYGEVEIAMSINSNDIDLFGSVVNNCSKINHAALSNELAIGNNLHETAKGKSFFKDYDISRITEKKDTANEIMDTLYSMKTGNLNQRSNAESNYKNEKERAQQKQRTKALDNTSIHIMLVDDDEDILYTFQTILKGDGYNVRVFSKSIEALTHFTDMNPNHYDLIIMDIRMPHLDGISLYYKFKAINPHIGILFVSALDLVQELLNSMPKINLNDIIKKPVDSKQLLLKIKSMI